MAECSDNHDRYPPHSPQKKKSTLVSLHELESVNTESNYDSSIQSQINDGNCPWYPALFMYVSHYMSAWFTGRSLLWNFILNEWPTSCLGGVKPQNKETFYESVQKVYFIAVEKFKFIASISVCRNTSVSKRNHLIRMSRQLPTNCCKLQTVNLLKDNMQLSVKHVSLREHIQFEAVSLFLPRYNSVERL